MSIIHEALKKVEASGIQKGSKDAPPQKRKLSLKLYIIYLLVAVLGFLSANFIFSLFTRGAHKAVIPAAAKAVAVKPPSPLPVSPAPLKEPRKEAPQLTLNGIFFSGNEGYALINNQIVREGDKVSGAAVLRITLEGVELKYGETAVNLSNQSK